MRTTERVLDYDVNVVPDQKGETYAFTAMAMMDLEPRSMYLSF